MVIQTDHAPLTYLPNQASVNGRIWELISIMQGYKLEIRHILGKRNPADTLSRQDKKDVLGRKAAVHDASADLVKMLRVPSDEDDVAIQEALLKLFNAQVRNQIESVAVEGQASRAKRSVTDSDQSLKGSNSVSDHFSPVQLE